MALNRDDMRKMLTSLLRLPMMKLCGGGLNGLVVPLQDVLDVVICYGALDLRVEKHADGRLGVVERDAPVPALKRYVVEGATRAVDCALALTRASRWFEVTPLPDDEFRYTTKDEPGAPSPFTVDEDR